MATFASPLESPAGDIAGTIRCSRKRQRDVPVPTVSAIVLRADQHWSNSSVSEGPPTPGAMNDACTKRRMGGQRRRRSAIGVSLAAALAGTAAVVSIGGGPGTGVGLVEASTRGHSSYNRGGTSSAPAGSVPSHRQRGASASSARRREKSYLHDHALSCEDVDAGGGVFAGAGGGSSSDSEGDMFDDDEEDLLFVDASSAWSMKVAAGGASGETADGGNDSSGESDSASAPENVRSASSDQEADAVSVDDATAESEGTAGHSQPLRTLKKLQAMLDDSDYATAATTSTAAAKVPAATASTTAKLTFEDDAGMTTQQAMPAVATSLSSQQPAPPPLPTPLPQPQKQEAEKLWTSKDRSKYKKQRRLRQERERREQLEEQRRKWQQAGLSLSSDDDDVDQKSERDDNDAGAALIATETDDDAFLTDGTTTEDDGLGYSLPNLPVYLSDSEGNSDDFELLDDDDEGDRAVPPLPPPAAEQFHQKQQQSQQRAQSYSSPQQPLPPPSQMQYQYHGQGLGQQSPSPSDASYNQLISGNQQQPLLPGDPYLQYPPYNPYQYYPQQQQQSGQYSQGPPMNYPYPYPGAAAPNQYNQQQYAHYMQQYSAWAAAAAATQANSGGSSAYPPPPPQGLPPYRQSNYNGNAQQSYPHQSPYAQGSFIPQPYVVPRPPAGTGTESISSKIQTSAKTKANVKAKGDDTNVLSAHFQGPGHERAASGVLPPQPQQQMPPSVPFAPQHPMPMEMMHMVEYGQEVSLAEASANISFDSIQKLVFVMVGVMLMSYCAVSPRTLPVVEYNMRFKENLQIVSLVLIAPIITSISVFDAKESDINHAISTFTSTFTLGYVMCFVSEIVWTTILRLGVFLIWEPAIFKLTPRVPTIVLPWVLRENKYRPKRITLFAADFASSCLAAPIIEEYIKLKLVQLGGRLPRNYRRVKRKKEKGNNKKSTKMKKKRKRYTLEKIERAPGEAEVTNVNVFITQMIAASVGLKLCDSVRRILMYTKRTDASKSFYAFARGVFPIHELCGTMTAIELAKRDLLGVDLPLWRILLPAVFIHGMANFRGMKPLFKWNSSTPWSEMQLSPWNVADDSTLGQMVSKGLAKLTWLIILGRVLGYCIKNYYLLKRQAMKRTTTYAGKQAAFSAELAATDYLKKTKKKGKANQD